MRDGDFSEVLALNPSFRIYDPATGTSDRRESHLLRRTRSSRPIASAASLRRSRRSIRRPTTPGTNNGLQNNLFLPRQPKADRDNYDAKVNWNRTPPHQIWGKFSMMQARGVRPVLPRPCDGAGGGEDEHEDLHRRPDLDAQPDPPLRCQRRRRTSMKQHMQGPDYGTNFGTDVWGIPGTERGRGDRSRFVRSQPVQRHAARSQTGLSQRWATPIRGRRCGATSAATRLRPT